MKQAEVHDTHVFKGTFPPWHIHIGGPAVPVANLALASLVLESIHSAANCIKRKCLSRCRAVKEHALGKLKWCQRCIMSRMNLSGTGISVHLVCVVFYLKFVRDQEGTVIDRVEEGRK